MSDAGYIHGYAPEEQERLLRQAEYWRHTLIPRGLAYRAGDRVLEIGCAAGATLGVLATTFPGIRVAGIDLEPRQVDFARRHLASLGVQADLRVGNAASMPWADGSFDHVYVMWVLEHLPATEAVPLLAEARRVLRPGGSIALTETDYTTFRVFPPSADFDILARAQHDLFARRGNALVGRQLPDMLRAAGFDAIRAAPLGFHFARATDAAALRAHVEYVADYLEPMFPEMVRELDLEPATLHRGLASMRSIPDHPRGAMTQIAFRALGRRPDETISDP